MPKMEFTACDDWRRHNHKFSYLVRDDEDDDDDGAGNVCVEKYFRVGTHLVSVGERKQRADRIGRRRRTERDRKFAM